MPDGAPAALIFDVDGVIIDSTEAHTEAWRRYLAQQQIEIEGISARMLGKHNDAIVREFFPSSSLTPEVITQHGRNKEQIYREIVAPDLQRLLVSGLHAFLEQHRSCPLAVASNAEMANVNTVLDAAGIRDYFRVIVTGDDGIRPKPAPDIYLEAAKRMGTPPQNCIVFEDSLTGVAAARAAHMSVVAVTTTLSEFEDVDLVISHFVDPALSSWLARRLEVAC